MSGYFPADAQITDDSSYAARLYHEQKFEQAALEYEWAVFQAQEALEKITYLTAKAECQKQSGDFNKALHTVNRAVALAKGNDSATAQLFQKRIFLHYVTQEYAMAIQDYYRLRKKPELQKEQLHLYALSRMRNHEDSAFFAALEQFAAITHNDTLVSRVQEQFKAVETLSPRKASILSAVIPGLGATAAGKPLQGIASLLIIGTFGYYGYYAFTNGMIGTGVFSGVMFPLRLYLGGINYAAVSAREKNLKKRNQIYNAIERNMLYTRMKHQNSN